MKVKYQAGNITFEQECSNRKDAITFIAQIMEVFTGEPCAVCVAAGKPGTNTAPSMRKYQDNVFYAHRCRDCTAELKIVDWEGKLFLSRQDREKKPLSHSGWQIYKGKDGGSQSAAPSEGGEPESPIPF